MDALPELPLQATHRVRELKRIVPPCMESFVLHLQPVGRSMSIPMGASVRIPVLGASAFSFNDAGAAFPNFEHAFWVKSKL